LILRNTPEARKPHLQRGKGLKSGYSITLENLKFELKCVTQIFVKREYKNDAKFLGTRLATSKSINYCNFFEKGN